MSSYLFIGPSFMVLQIEFNQNNMYIEKYAPSEVNSKLSSSHCILGRYFRLFKGLVPAALFFGDGLGPWFLFVAESIAYSEPLLSIGARALTGSFKKLCDSCSKMLDKTCSRDAMFLPRNSQTQRAPPGGEFFSFLRMLLCSILSVFISNSTLKLGRHFSYGSGHTLGDVDIASGSVS